MVPKGLNKNRDKLFRFYKKIKKNVYLPHCICSASSTYSLLLLAGKDLTNKVKSKILSSKKKITFLIVIFSQLIAKVSSNKI